jgi:hypothetical protein
MNKKSARLTDSCRITGVGILKVKLNCSNNPQGTMTKTKLSLSIAVLSASLLGSTTGFAAVVYDNSVNSLGRSYSPAAVSGAVPEFGDQVFLSGSDRRITDFQFEYFLSVNASGNETAELFFHQNNSGVSGIDPGTVLYRSGEFSLSTGFQTVVAQALSVSLPSSTFTWSVVFNGIEGAEAAGLLLYNPPTIGSSFDDFWQKNANGTWSTFLVDAGATPANFAARITAVPEPGTYALAVVGGLILAGYRRMKRRSA